MDNHTHGTVKCSRPGLIAALALIMLAASGLTAGRVPDKRREEVSFSKDIRPLIGKRCLPCHASDNFNPSELSLDSYESLIAGGKNGASVIPGDSQGSILVKKMGVDPPFGDRMPLQRKNKTQEAGVKWLSESERRIIADWIDQGAKNN